MLKFTKGFKDLTSLDFGRFNTKVQAKEADVRSAFFDDQANYVLVPIYTGQEALALEPQRDLDDCLADFNDTANEDARELLQTRVLRQSDVHGFLTRGTQGLPIDLEVVLFQFGEVAKPFAVYGQVSAADVAGWWSRHYPKIVAPNIRMFLGADAEVNMGIQSTLLNTPESFWHLNNGITITCKEIRRTLVGGPGKETGFFKCSDVSIVNGAQTAGSIAAAFARRPDVVSRAWVAARFITVNNDEDHDFGLSVTRATNTQNRITRQDFAALDAEQERIRTELALEGVTYNYKSSDAPSKGDYLFGFEEAVVALACAHSDLGLSSQAKREVGKLWDDTSKAPYKALFNSGTSSATVWRLGQIMRVIDAGLQKKFSELEGRDKGYSVHGNRFVAHQVFRRLLPAVVAGSSPMISSDTIKDITGSLVGDIALAANDIHPGAYLAQLFKNHKKLQAVDAAINS